MYKLSVIIPVYNVENYLRECLDSIINQTVKDIEIICVDDGSTDSSPDILKEYQNKDSRIRIITKENGGQASARNLGIKEAQGEYIVFIDSDDFIESEMLENLLFKVSEYSKHVIPDIVLDFFCLVVVCCNLAHCNVKVVVFCFCVELFKHFSFNEII